MRVLNPTDNLPEEELRLFFWDIIILYIIVELSSIRELHDDEDIISRIKHLVQLDNVLVIDELEYLDFPLHLNQHTSTFEIIFLFFIFRLLMIFTATFTPVKSCLASNSQAVYLWP